MGILFLLLLGSIFIFTSKETIIMETTGYSYEAQVFHFSGLTFIFSDITYLLFLLALALALLWAIRDIFKFVIKYIKEY